jgi:NADPH-dependent 2,4-dienoyl-CoA reductase/sulfur reductase-like enzyme/nitrite reductase/ring-hydroxylating ferredoxin subunit
VEHDVASLAELAEGSMRKVEIDGHAVLLARVDGTCYAIDNACPHAGGPLDEGVLDGEVVLCPWHKAGFSVVTGQHVEPPAVDDVRRFDVRVEHGRVLVSADDAARPLAPARGTAPDGRCFAIVGAGAAGTVAAQTLRSHGFGGSVVLIGEETELPYDRTVLSKYTLAGTQGGEKTPLQDAKFYADHRIERRLGTVARIDPASRLITFADGGSLAYDTALVATGGVPRRLNVQGDSVQGVFGLRSAADARAIALAAAHATSAVVSGSGFIAMEAAASLRERGLDVTLVAPQKAPFERQFGAEIGNAFRRMLEHKEIVFRLEQEIAAIIGPGRVESVTLRDGTQLPADLVIIGSGIEPATGFLPASLHRKDGGLQTDSRLRVHDGLFAAGDIAAFPLRGDGDHVRVEHWRVAQQHGRVAASNMLGIDTPFEAVPYFWTTYFTKRLDYVGHAESWDDVVIDGDLDTPDFVALYMQAGVVAAVAGVGRDQQMAAALHLLTKQRRPTIDLVRAAMEKA